MSKAQDQKISKVAVDDVAKEFYRNYYADSGYGELWVRDIPMRVKAELAKKASKTASAKLAGAMDIRPLATVITDQGVHLEGIAVSGQGDAKRVQAFVADFDHEGNVVGFDSVSA